MSKAAREPDSKAKAIGRRAEELRKARGMTQEAAAKASGSLARTEITKLETGYSKASTARVQTAIARAYSVPVELVEPYLHGRIELEDFLSHGGPGGYARFGNLEAALAYHGDRWSAPTIAATRAYALTQVSDPEGPEWASLLDRVEEALSAIGLVRPDSEAPSARNSRERSE